MLGAVLWRWRVHDRADVDQLPTLPGGGGRYGAAAADHRGDDVVAASVGPG